MQTDAAAEKLAVIVMGVSGSGKTTVATLLAQRFGWAVAEADDFHSAANKSKMAAGTPLTDEDRAPWLQSLREWIDNHPGNVILTCSALKRSYRDVLRSAEARVVFLHLVGARDTIDTRMAARIGHFMPKSLLESQLATLEPLGLEEDGAVIDIDGTPQDVTDRAQQALGLEVAK